MRLQGWLLVVLPGSPDSLQWPWAAALVAGAMAGLAGWWLSQRHTSTGALPLSHSVRLAALARYTRLVARRRRLVGLRCVAALVLVGGCLLVISRPVDIHSQKQWASRDLLICLDVSRSMRSTAEDVTRVFQEVVGSLPGDRVGLTIFDGKNVVKFPLTDAEQYVKTALEQAHTAFRTGDRAYTRGAYGYPSSQLGDGLHSCVEGFDRLDEHRGRAVLVASDNHPFGRPAYTLDDAAELARQRGVVVYGLGVPSLSRRPSALAEFRSAVESTGGSLVMVDETDAVQTVASRIDRIQRRRLDEPPRTVIDDETAPGTLLALTGLLGLALLGVRRST